MCNETIIKYPVFTGLAGYITDHCICTYVCLLFGSINLERRVIETSSLVEKFPPHCVCVYLTCVYLTTWFSERSNVTETKWNFGSADSPRHSQALSYRAERYQTGRVIHHVLEKKTDTYTVKSRYELQKKLSGVGNVNTGFFRRSFRIVAVKEM